MYGVWCMFSGYFDTTYYLLVLATCFSFGPVDFNKGILGFGDGSAAENTRHHAHARILLLYYRYVVVRVSRVPVGPYFY